MYRWIADTIRRAGPVGAIGGGAVLLGIGALAASAAASSGATAWARPLGTLLGAGLVAVGWGIHAGLSPAGQRWFRAGAWVVGIAGIAAILGGVGAGLYARETRRLCGVAARGAFTEDSRAIRESALREALHRTGRVGPVGDGAASVPGGALLTWIETTLDEDPTRDCRQAEADFARLSHGLCPMEPIDGVPCRCGSGTWPDGTGCVEKPSCIETGFNCWRDTLPRPGREEP